MELEPTYPCADYKPGEDDLQNFDMIRKFQLDVNLDGYPGVTRVRGSNRMQTAYRIDTSANLKMPTMRVFDQGLPEQFGLFHRWIQIDHPTDPDCLLTNWEQIFHCLQRTI